MHPKADAGRQALSLGVRKARRRDRAGCAGQAHARQRRPDGRGRAGGHGPGVCQRLLGDGASYRRQTSSRAGRLDAAISGPASLLSPSPAHDGRASRLHRPVAGGREAARQGWVRHASCVATIERASQTSLRDRMFRILCGRRFLRRSNLALALVLTATLTPQAFAGPKSVTKTITAVMHSDLRVIDPGFTTAYITRDHGYMIYDTLLAMDANFKIQPQMADWKISDDKLTYTFTLRDGLKWHDGAPVTAEDCVASLKRWGRNDSMGQKLMDYAASLEATDAKTITLKLKEPYGLVLESTGKPSSLVPFMMPKRMAETPPGQQIKEQIGSGPFKFA